MNDTRNGAVYGALFFLFIVILVVGGYFLTVKITLEEDKKTPNTEEVENKEEVINDDLKINKDLEYIYFENSETISLEHEIVYQDIVININSSEATNLADTLNSEMTNLKKTFKKLSEEDLDEEEEEKILYKEDDIYSASFRKYTQYFNKNYASLILEDYNYDCFNGSAFQKVSAYVFDTNTGKILTKDELLDLYEYNLDKIKTKVKDNLEKQQTTIDGTPLIDIDRTLSNLNDPEGYALFINKNGFLTISYIVKTTQVDYNDVIILN